ncbi:hypothetical protein ACFQ3R_05250 [Mesonia ostreae]|uniref:C-type lysozyme inhibitor domain-containing protein n=1 Tax=Mesonia ostreae TaxID=861110 RepID=A0ABU2KK67_9FLAO|nr:hypothetical protein [Mesonia ostreae]MDT0295069.1 hypothetical protein [Mesonia ostreae]
MKKIIIIALVCGLSFTSCDDQNNQKETETKENKPVKDFKGDNTTQLKSNEITPDHLYKSDNGEIIEVHFIKENDEDLLKIDRKNQDEVVLKKSSRNSDMYEKENYSWKKDKENITFSEGKKSMNLVLISPLEYQFTSDDLNMTVIYFSKDDKRFVSLEKENQSKITLKQISAWAKGAEYGKGKVKWRSQGSTGVLTENGEKTTFKQKK